MAATAHPLLPDKLSDFVELTINNFKRRTWTDISLDLQKYVVASRLFQRHKVKERGGPKIDFKVQTTNTGTAKNTAMYAIDATLRKDLMTNGTESWTKQTVNYSYDIDEPYFQTDLETIVRELQVLEHSAYNDMFELHEENLWTAPASTTQDPRVPSGVPYWIIKDATTTPAGAFSGGNPAGNSSGAGNISTTTYPNWDNWTWGYTGSASSPTVTRDEFVERARKACEFTYFKAPHAFSETSTGFGEMDTACYTTWRVLTLLEKLLEGRNDNLGADLNKFRGSVLLKGNPVDWVPYLETNDTSDPFYGINWRYFSPYVRRGKDWFRHPIKQSAHQHSVKEVHIDTWMNYICYNRRRQFVGSHS